MARETVVSDIEVLAIDEVIEVLAGHVLGSVIHAPLLVEAIGAKAEIGEDAFAHGDAAIAVDNPAGIAGFHQSPRDLFPFAGILAVDDVLENTSGVSHVEVFVQVAVVAPYAVVISCTGTGTAEDHLGIAFISEVMGGRDGLTVCIEVVRIPLKHLDDGHAGVGNMGRQVIFGQGIHVILGIAANRAGRASTLLDGVLFSDFAEVEHALVAAQSSNVDHAAGLLAGIDLAVRSLVPGDAGGTLPAVLGSNIFRPALCMAGHGMVVVAADEILDHVVGQETDFHGTGDLDSAGAADRDALALLATQQSADSAAAAVAEGSDDVGHGNEVLTGRTDGGHVEFRSVFLGQGCIGFERALAPDMGSIFDGDVFVFDLDVDRMIALAFHDHCVIAGILEGMSNVAAHVGINDGIAQGPAGKQGDIHTTGAGDT